MVPLTTLGGMAQTGDEDVAKKFADEFEVKNLKQKTEVGWYGHEPEVNGKKS